MYPDTSDVLIVTAPVRPATDCTSAETVPAVTASPVPTVTMPAAVVVARDSLGVGTVPVERSVADPEVAIDASPDTSAVLSVTVPVLPATDETGGAA